MYLPGGMSPRWHYFDDEREESTIFVDEIIVYVTVCLSVGVASIPEIHV